VLENVHRKRHLRKLGSDVLTHASTCQWQRCHISSPKTAFPTLHQMLSKKGRHVLPYTCTCNYSCLSLQNSTGVNANKNTVGGEVMWGYGSYTCCLLLYVASSNAVPHQLTGSFSLLLSCIGLGFVRGHHHATQPLPALRTCPGKGVAVIVTHVE